MKLLHYLLSLDKGWFPMSMEYLLNYKQFGPISVKFFDVLLPHMMVPQASSIDGRLEGGKHWHAHLFSLGWTCFFHFSVCLYYCNNICGHWWKMHDKGCTYTLSRKVEKKIVTQQKRLQNNFPSDFHYLPRSIWLKMIPIAVFPSIRRVSWHYFFWIFLLPLFPMVFVNMYFLKLHMLAYIFFRGIDCTMEYNWGGRLQCQC